MSFLDKFFAPSYEKELKAVGSIINSINGMETEIEALSDDELVQRANNIKAKIQAGEDMDNFLAESFALTREASKRTLGLRHYDVQLVGGIILHRGKITEMRTGEGKTLVGTLPATLNAFSGKGVHVVTVNDYLSRRDAVWMGQIYAKLGLTVGVINSGASYIYDEGHIEKDEERDERGAYKVVYDFLRPCSRNEAYEADITYGTNSEFGFDYLRDNIEYESNNIRQKNHAYAIVDEIDSILIDEARTPLIISAPSQDSENLYTTFANIARNLKEEEHFTIDEKLKAVALTDAGIEEAEKMLGVSNIYSDKGIKYVHHLETAVRAKATFKKDKEYVVRDGEVVIVDEFTGRLQPGRRWSDGLHQAIEAKEGVPIQKESKTFASITYQNYFRLYEKLSGMTGTALTSQEEFYTVYQLEVVPIPTNKPIKRLDHNDQIYQNEPGKFEAIIKRVKELHDKKQPVLIGTASIESNERLSAALGAAEVPHEMLNAKNHEREGEIIASAGRKGAVTLATNMAGRGVDIKLGGPEATPEESDEIRELGGLFVLGTERHEARRIDNQLRGRSGRQGDPGETQFYVSMEDELMRRFGGDRVKSLMGTFGIPADQPIEMKMLSNTLETAQTRIEGFHFDSRKQILAYDDVLNQQRMVIYKRRNAILVGNQDELDTLLAEVENISPEAKSAIDAKMEEFTKEGFFVMFRKLALQTMDTLWVEHLEVMSHTRSSVNLRAYGQRDPLIEYRKEGTRLFSELQNEFLFRLAKTLPNVQPVNVEREEQQMKERAQLAQKSAGLTTSAKRQLQQKTVDKTPGRNESVTITDGKEQKTLKYKKAEPLLASGAWKMM